MKNYYVYILTNKSNTLYIGITNNIQRRLYEHKHHKGSDFTQRYNINKLIYLETYNDVIEAIAREKQLKKWSRVKKLTLIKQQNPMFEELSI